MARKISHDMAWFVFLAAFLPFLVASSLLFTWSQADKELSEARASEQLVRVKTSTRRILERIDVVTDMGATSREVVDFILMPEKSRSFGSNLVTGRLAQIQEKAPEISGWAILDSAHQVIFSMGERVPSPPEEGFLLDGQRILFTKAINVDDQYLESGATSLRGFVATVIPVRNIAAQVPGLSTVTAVPRRLSQGDLEVQTSGSEEHDRKIWAAILVLATFMVVSILAGLMILYRRVLSPIHVLTGHVKEQKYGAPLSKEGQNLEISILTKAFDDYARSLSDQAGKEAVVQTMQILAHDVRKPFSMVKILLSILNETSEVDEMKGLCAKFVPEVEKSIKSVEDMILDIMEVGAQPSKMRESVDPAALTEGAVADAFQFNKESRVGIEYVFDHQHKVMAHTLKTSRVFSNLISNALHATGPNGSLWFSTKECDGFVQFTIGNSGSRIEEEDVSRLFEPFFTKGKAKGTGLGLTIAKKVVNEHGGDIWCESLGDRGVEFHFTLPCSHEKSPARSSGLPTRQDESALRVLICEDEELYRRSLIRLMDDFQKDHPEIVLALTIAETFDEASLLIPKVPFDLAIVDIDLGDARSDGWDLLKMIKKERPAARICVHSNRVGAHDKGLAQKVEADAVWPKPMSTEQFRMLARFKHPSS